MVTRFAIVAVLLALPAAAMAQIQQGAWELTLSGNGNNDHDFTTGAFAVNGSLGYFLTNEIELSLRQGVIWSDGGSSWNGDTRIAGDYNFKLGDQWVPFAGANVGYQYGEDVDDQWIGGPEVGLKFFVNKTTFIEVVASYEFSICKGLDEGAFFYGLGIGFTF